MHSPLPSCTCRVGVAGDGCRYKSEVIKEESIVAEDQRDKQERKRYSVETEACKYRKFERQRATSGANRVSV